VEIRWPSGAIDVLKDLAADNFYGVLEGTGVVPPEKIRPSPVKAASPEQKAAQPATPASTPK